jgi:hypothetical protein
MPKGISQEEEPHMCSICRLERDLQGNILAFLAYGERRFEVGQKVVVNEKAPDYMGDTGDIVRLYDPNERRCHTVIAVKFEGDPLPYCLKPEEIV